MTLRICHLISGDLWAGAEAMAFNLLNGLQARAGIDLFVIVLNDGALMEKLERAGIDAMLIDESNRSFLEIASLALRLVRSRKPQIIHSHRYKENLLAYVLTLLSGNAPKLVSTQHGMPEFFEGIPGRRQRLKTWFNYRLLANKFHKTVAVSSEITRALTNQFGFSEQRLKTIHNGIVIPSVRPQKNHKDNFVIGSAGRFFPVKDYCLMVDIASEVCGKTDRVTFELAGEGPMLGRIQESIHRHGLENKFMLRGFISDVAKFYAGLDIYINTSIHEGIPMSVLEAMAYGVPAIAPKVGGFEEIVTNGVDGFLVDERNPGAFADKCLALCLDKDLRGRMAQTAREKIVGQFSVDRMVCSYLDLYAQAVDRSGHAMHPHQAA